MNSYVFVNCVEIYKLKAKYSDINAVSLSLDYISKVFLVDNMKSLDYMDMSMIFQSIMIILMLLIFWIFINI